MSGGQRDKDERSQREAIVRAVYEDNLRLREPGYHSSRSVRQRRLQRRTTPAAAILLIVVATLLYDRLPGIPMNSLARADSKLTVSTTGGEKTTAANTRTVNPVRAVATTTATADPPEIAAPEGAITRLGEAPADDAGDVQPSVRALLGLSVRTIVIDAGHGGRDPGAIGRAGTREKDVALDIARRLKGKLARSTRFRIFLVRDSDAFVPLNERVAYANSHGADLFVSIHVNYLDAISANAIETYYFGEHQDAHSRTLAQRENEHSAYTISEFGELMGRLQNSMKLQESKALANSIQATLLGNIRQQDRTVLDTGVRSAPFVVLVGVKAPSVLAEIGSLSSAQAERRLGEPHYRDQIATYLATGITEYLDNQPQEAEAHHVKGKDGIAKH